MGPAKDKHGVRESFAKVKFLFAKNGPFRDKGILINNHIYIYYGCIIKENWWIKQNENMRLAPINMGFNMIFDDLANKVWNN